MPYKYSVYRPKNKGREYKLAQYRARFSKDQALRAAVLWENVPETERLLLDGADPEYKTDRGYQDDLWELVLGRTDQPVGMQMLRVFALHAPLSVERLQNGVELLFNLMSWQSVNEEHTEILDILLKRGCTLEQRVYDFRCDNPCRMPPPVIVECTALQRSVINQKSDMVKVLIERGATVSENKYYEWPLFHLAAAFGYSDVVRGLLEKGAAVNKVWFAERDIYDKEMWIVRLNKVTPLHLACRAPDRLDVIHALLEYGADVNVLDSDGRTPLMQEGLCDPERRLLIKELARLRFTNKPICEENMNCVEQSRSMHTLFQDCLDELQKIKSIRLFKDLSLCDILVSRKENETLSVMAERASFPEELSRLICGCDSIKLYADFFPQSVRKAVKRRKIVIQEVEKLRPIFANIFTDLIIDKIAFFVCADLF